jgi:hypothetical protein
MSEEPTLRMKPWRALDQPNRAVEKSRVEQTLVLRNHLIRIRRLCERQSPL